MQLPRLPHVRIAVRAAELGGDLAEQVHVGGRDTDPRQRGELVAVISGVPAQPVRRSSRRSRMVRRLSPGERRAADVRGGTRDTPGNKSAAIIDPADRCVDDTILGASLLADLAAPAASHWPPGISRWPPIPHLAPVCDVTGAIVFPEPSVPRDRWLGWAEPLVNLYLESTRPEAVVAREWINAAYRRFPDPTGELAGRLRSTDNVQHSSALDELFVHDRLVRHGRVVHEEGGVGPDFRIYRDDEYLGAVEVCSLFENKEWEAEQKRHARIVDELNQRIPLEMWFVHFDVIRLNRSPSINQLVAWVRARIAELPTGPAAAADPLTPWVTYEADGIELRFRFLRRRSSSPPEPTDRIVGTGQAIGGFVDSFLRLRSALEKKVQKRYDTRSKPLAIFVGAWDSACTVDQFEDARQGNEQVLVNSGEIERAKNGFFGRNRERPAGKHREISCVVALRGWRPWQPDNPSILRFDNPFAAVSFPDELLPADYRLGVVRDERTLWLEWTPTRPGLA